MYTNRPRLEQSSTNPLGALRRSWWPAVILLLLLPAQASAVDSALMRSLLVPGLGQAHQGHYTRAAVYAGSAVLTGFGLFLSHMYYNEAVDKFHTQRDLYVSYGNTLAAGGVVSIEEIQGTYEKMQAEFNSAEDRLVWRNAFLTALVATYAINIVDVLISKPYQADKTPLLGLEVGRGNFRVTKSFRF